MAKKTGTRSHMWTKDEISKVMKLWEEYNIDQIADKIGLKRQQVQYIAARIRKLAPNVIPKKHRGGTTDALIKEVLERGSYTV